MRSGSARTGPGTRRSRPGRGGAGPAAAGDLAMARAWRCFPGRGDGAPGPRSRRCGPLTSGPGPGEEGHKRMAETGCVFDVAPAQERDPGAGHAPGPRQRREEAPRAQNAGIPAISPPARRHHRQGLRRGRPPRPGRARTWIALVDGISARSPGSRPRPRPAHHRDHRDRLHHVLEYLWKAAWCFHRPRDPAMEDWVTAGAGHPARPGAGRDQPDQALAAEHPPGGGEHAKIIRKTLHYSSQAALPGLPRAWRPAGRSPPASSRAPAAPGRRPDGHHRRPLEPGRSPGHTLAPRIAASGDTSAYWDYHIRKNTTEPLSRYQPARPRCLTVLTPKEPHPCRVHVRSCA